MFQTLRHPNNMILQFFCLQHKILLSYVYVCIVKQPLVFFQQPRRHRSTVYQCIDLMGLLVLLQTRD